RHGRALSRACAATPMNEARVHDRAGEPPLAHCEREIAVVAVKEPVTFVEAADFVEERVPEAQADAVDSRHLDHGRLHAGAALEAVDDGAPDVAAVAAHP